MAVAIKTETLMMKGKCRISAQLLTNVTAGSRYGYGRKGDIHYILKTYIPVEGKQGKHTAQILHIQSRRGGR